MSPISEDLRELDSTAPVRVDEALMIREAMATAKRRVARRRRANVIGSALVAAVVTLGGVGIVNHLRSPAASTEQATGIESTTVTQSVDRMGWIAGDPWRLVAVTDERGSIDVADLGAGLTVDTAGGAEWKDGLNWCWGRLTVLGDHLRAGEVRCTAIGRIADLNSRIDRTRKAVNHIFAPGDVTISQRTDSLILAKGVVEIEFRR